eukprot:15415154-Alexandrium_andersonii.AAC.1
MHTGTDSHRASSPVAQAAKVEGGEFAHSRTFTACGCPDEFGKWRWACFCWTRPGWAVVSAC